MTVLSSKKILEGKNATDYSSIVSLTLTHKALSDVSCLGEFKNLEKLDLSFNNLTSLEGLKSCLNLKWLSVANNKIQSLRGIEGLSKLTVLNAGKNKLNSMNEVQSLTSLKALILNDNEITSVCKLQPMKELNTLVLSRNPISSLGESLANLKSITKLSLSNCNLLSIDSSLKSCLGLKELRLAHNEIVSIPSDFGHLAKLQNLDLGNNLISNWANLKVLSSLVNLKNLNLQGNPIAEKEHFLKKVKKILPNLHIFNARPVDKFSVKESRDETADVSVEARKKGEDSADEAIISEKNVKKKMKLRQDVSKILPGEAKTGKLKKRSIELSNEPDLQLNGDATKECHKNLRTKHVNVQDNIIDCADTPFVDLFASVSPQVSIETLDRTLDHKTDRDTKSVSELGANTSKKNKRKYPVSAAAIEFLPADEIGVGGPSTWADL